MKDLEEIPAEVRDVLQVHPVESMDEVLRLALDGDFRGPPRADGKFGDAAADPPDSGPVAH